MKKHSRGYLRWVGWLVAVALLTAGGWAVWWNSPRSYRAVAAIPTGDDTLAPCARGVLVTEGNGQATFVLRSWQDGSVLWKVTPPGNAGVQSGKPSYPWSISPSGQYLAISAQTGDGGGQQVITWKDGKQVGVYDGLMFPSGTGVQLMVPHLKALDDGRVFVYPDTPSWYPGANGPRSLHQTKPAQPQPPMAYLLQGSRLLAKGSFLAGHQLTIAPDGTAVAGISTGGFNYAGITLKDGRMLLHDTYTNPALVDANFYRLGSSPELPMMAGGLLLTRDGGVYGPKGRITAAPGSDWNAMGLMALSYDGQYTCFVKGTHPPYDGSSQSAEPEPTRRSVCRMRIFAPVTGQYWEWNRVGNVWGGLACGNRNVLLIYEYQTPTRLRQLVGWLPKVKERLDKKFVVLGLHDRDGHLRAALSIASEDDGVGLKAFGKKYDTVSFAPSPDGRTLVFIGHEGGEQGYPIPNSPSTFLLFRY